MLAIITKGVDLDTREARTFKGASRVERGERSRADAGHRAAEGRIRAAGAASRTSICATTVRLRQGRREMRGSSGVLNVVEREVALPRVELGLPA